MTYGFFAESMENVLEKMKIYLLKLYGVFEGNISGYPRLTAFRS